MGLAESSTICPHSWSEPSNIRVGKVGEFSRATITCGKCGISAPLISSLREGVSTERKWVTEEDTSAVTSLNIFFTQVMTTFAIGWFTSGEKEKRL